MIVEGLEMDITNPCRGVCSIHTEYKICLGCYRTRLEILKWNLHSTTDGDRLVILQSIEVKRQIYGNIESRD